MTSLESPDRSAAQVDEFEDRYPVTPLQYGMLLHTRSAPGDGVYVQQKILTLRERLDVPTFERALANLVRRHPVLRTTFQLDAGSAVQTVRRDAAVDVEQHDWRELRAAEQRQRLRAFLETDRRRPFELGPSTPMRFTLFRMAGAHYELVWSSHHALMDGRSYLILLTELFDTYAALAAGEPIERRPAPPFAAYVRWLTEQDATRALSFWRERLSGVTSATPLPADAAAPLSAGDEAFADRTTEVPAHATAGLVAAAERHGITVHSLTQAAWALLLHRASGCDDVLFGSTKSCRAASAAAADAADMAGLCINTVPFRARIDPASTVAGLARELRQQQLAVRGFEHAPLPAIRTCCDLPNRDALFESVVVFEDYLLDARLRSRGGAWTNRELRIEERSHYPLTLYAYLDTRLVLRLAYDRRRFLDATAERILDYLRSLIEAMAAVPEARLRDVLRTAEGGDLPPAGVQPVELLCPERSVASAARGDVPVREEEWTVSVPTAIATGDEWLLAVLLAFLARVSGEEGGHVDLQWPPRVGCTPFPVPDLGDARSVSQLCAELHQQLERRPACFPARGLPVAIELVNAPGAGAGRRPGTAVQVEILKGSSTYRWRLAGDRGDRTSRQALRDRFTSFLSALAASPDGDVTRLPLLSGEDRRLLAEWNATAVEYPRDRCAHQLFMEQARRRTDAPAVVFEGRALSYRELDRRSSQLAAFLAHEGIGPGSIVGVYLTRSEHAVVALLAIMKSGAAYVPMDTTYPRERIAYMLSDTDLSVLLTESRLRGRLPECGAAIVALDESRDAIAAAPDEPFDRAAPEGLAYVIYTSGSTGSPKGVKVGHRALTNLLCSMARRPGFTESDRLLAVTTICFDIAALELFLPLVCGGCVEVLPARAAGDGLELRTHVERSRPTVMQATPTAWKMLRAAGWRGDPELKLLCGGEALDAGLADDLVARVREVWNLYGPTETTIWSSVAAVERHCRITIGRPIANTQFHVLDKRLQPTPPGAAGELFISGDGVAAGYVNRPELTRDRFVPCLSDGTGGVMYRTGDMVRFLPDGSVEYLRRVDRQVKLHGYRIELGEIEHALRAHPALVDAAAMVREDARGDRRLVAYLVARQPGGELRAAQLRAHLKSTLPEYMIPAAYVVLERFPLTLNGKIDYNALPPPVAATTAASATSLPAHDVEQRIASIWRSVLGRQCVDLNANFFEIGGNSLLALELAARLRAELSGSLATGDLFTHPTIRAMARAARQQHEAGWRQDRTRATERLERRQSVLGDLRRARLNVTMRRERPAAPPPRRGR